MKRMKGNSTEKSILTIIIVFIIVISFVFLSPLYAVFSDWVKSILTGDIGDIEIKISNLKLETKDEFDVSTYITDVDNELVESDDFITRNPRIFGFTLENTREKCSESNNYIKNSMG